MNRQAVIASIISLSLGVSITNWIHSSKAEKMVALSNQQVEMTKSYVKCMALQTKWGDYHTELFKLAKSYEDTKEITEKVKIAESLSYKIREKNLAGAD